MSKLDPEHINIATVLQEALALKREIVLDFTSLKACLDPQREKLEGEEFNYEDFLYQHFDKGDTFSNLEVLKVRNLKISQPLTPQNEDYYADLLYGTMQFSNLVELDLSGNVIPQELQKYLTFWNMQNLKRLCLDGMALSALPQSVGILRQLEVLSVNDNQLRDLPVTLTSCVNLKELNLKNNNFNRLPGILLRLPKLQELRRLDNPLPQLFGGFEQPPHINIKTPSTTKQPHTTSNPDSLQSLCSRVVFTQNVDYWSGGRVGSLQCKLLDSLAAQFTLCAHCHKAIPTKGERNLTVDVMLLRYLELRFVPVQFAACSEECQMAVLQYYRQHQAKTQIDLDREYEESIKQALKQAKSSGAVIVSEDKMRFSSGRTNPCRRHKCSIM